MSNYRLVVSDLDGTLLDRNMRVSPENQKAIAEMNQRGIFFVPSSGRTLEEMFPDVREQEAIRYIIHSDGAVIYDKKTKIRYTACMDREQMKGVMDILDDYPNTFTMRAGGKVWMSEEETDPNFLASFHVNHGFSTLFAQTANLVPDFLAFCRAQEEVEQLCIFFREREDLRAAKARLEAMGMQVVSSDPDNIEVISPLAGKGTALLRLAEMLGISREDVIGMGDGVNDISMLQTAGLGLAMANAREEVKEIADRVICKHTEHGAAYVLEHYLQ